MVGAGGITDTALQGLIERVKHVGGICGGDAESGKRYINPNRTHWSDRHLDACRSGIRIL